jgi:hypothetical protein
MVIYKLIKEKTMRKLLIVTFLVVFLSQASFADVLPFSITPKQSNYKDFRFTVEYLEQHEIVTVVISVVPGNRKKIEQDGYIQISNNNKFVFSNVVHRSEKISIPYKLRQKFRDSNEILFIFNINPDYINGSWFKYLIYSNDGSVERNCIIKLKDFIEVTDDRRITSFDSRPGVQAQGKHEYMYVKSSGRKVGFSALEFERIARNYAKDNKLTFNFKRADKSIWIRTDGSPVIADVYFSHGLGEPVLRIEIDKDGNVIKHNIAIGIDRNGNK